MATLVAAVRAATSQSDDDNAYTLRWRSLRRSPAREVPRPAPLALLGQLLLVQHADDGQREVLRARADRLADLLDGLARVLGDVGDDRLADLGDVLGRALGGLTAALGRDDR